MNVTLAGLLVLGLITGVSADDPAADELNSYLMQLAALRDRWHRIAESADAGNFDSAMELFDSPLPVGLDPAWSKLNADRKRSLHAMVSHKEAAIGQRNFATWCFQMEHPALAAKAYEELRAKPHNPLSLNSQISRI